MAHCTDRKDKFSGTIDEIDHQIALLIEQRQDMMRHMPAGYDCDGEGIIYFDLELEDGERIYHAIAGIK